MVEAIWVSLAFLLGVVLPLTAYVVAYKKYHQQIRKCQALSDVPITGDWHKHQTTQVLFLMPFFSALCAAMLGLGYAGVNFYPIAGLVVVMQILIMHGSTDSIKGVLLLGEFLNQEELKAWLEATGNSTYRVGSMKEMKIRHLDYLPPIVAARPFLAKRIEYKRLLDALIKKKEDSYGKGLSQREQNAFDLCKARMEEIDKELNERWGSVSIATGRKPRPDDIEQAVQESMKAVQSMEQDEAVKKEVSATSVPVVDPALQELYKLSENTTLEPDMMEEVEQAIADIEAKLSKKTAEEKAKDERRAIEVIIRSSRQHHGV